MPNTNTGPAMVKVFTPIPVIMPSLLNSIAGETTALANPVMGTSVPAPANRAMLSKHPNPVKSADRKISEMETPARAMGRLSPHC